MSETITAHLRFADHIGLDDTRVTLPAADFHAAIAEGKLEVWEGHDYDLGEDYWGDWYIHPYADDELTLLLDYRPPADEDHGGWYGEAW
ncbi:hypothetical protein CcrC1_gp062c [Caulobacter phage C1]|nr:hypothetical protein CcrC1_gp062c [Caulobacter phage C1]UTU08289.1 hypothetical protein CcrC2_gp061c [Caulobacter phage C2]UTU08812.1 hypothetical protein CcrJ4_gp061c [Caulobacter phage J4]UTU09364.1 hypothetical protein CcrBL47_gp078c [Caulobacter phage BL47]UTU09924.1 hypothetical protein CcrRB23_gp062c [Caulobacter phage RB23]WGN96949.1 hypothetical protein [Bertelyvirus sp.]